MALPIALGCWFGIVGWQPKPPGNHWLKTSRTQISTVCWGCCSQDSQDSQTAAPSVVQEQWYHGGKLRDRE